MRWSSSKSMWLTSGAHRLHHWHQPPCPLCTTSLAAMAMEIPLETDEVELLKGYVAHIVEPTDSITGTNPCAPYAQQIWQQWQWRYNWRQMRWSSSNSMWLTSGAHQLHHWHQLPVPPMTGEVLEPTLFCVPVYRPEAPMDKYALSALSDDEDLPDY